MEIALNSPLDMHLHVRDSDMLKTVAPLSSYSFAGAVIMPNIVPPVTSREELIAYKKRVSEATEKDNFTPYMTLFFKDSYDFDFLKELKEEIIGIKLYPSGITTNSDGGVESLDIKNLKKTLLAMSELEIPLLVHGESDGFVMDREKEFAKVYKEIAENFPKLKIVMEHITTKDSVELLDRYENLYATVTLHHLLFTLDDVVGGLMRPHHFCKPIAKRYEDRDALLEVALNSHPKVMFGSDSAPHPKSAKESCGCAAGVFSAPIALQILCGLFEDNGKLNNLENFVSKNAQKIYGIKPIRKMVVLEKKSFSVPDNYGGVVPIFANSEIDWSIVDVV